MAPGKKRPLVSLGKSKGGGKLLRIGLDETPAVYLGIDPGASGGMVRLRGKEVIAVALADMTPRDVWGWLLSRIAGLEVFAHIEKVGGFIQGSPAPGSAMFNFGDSYGGLRMALIAASVAYEEVPPQTWQAGLKIPRRGKGESKKDWKNRLKSKAQQLFPRETVTLATADALLIAEYCRRKREGTL